LGNRENGAVFRQSLLDFPCPVALGRDTPSFSLHRFKPGLRFIPPNDEGYTIRGDRRRLVYKGRRRSHRFTILGDYAFEYDCILEREPNSNVIALYLEGAENFDFFRQPDFVPDDFLKGSYAVYKKDTLIGEGTGKLCHIHRPEIIDARGRRCWGELSVDGNELRIIIPEWFLSGAKYPVIVDPTIGTTTVGSFCYPVASPDYGSMIIYEIAVNKFLAPERIEGQCTAWAYFSRIDPNDVFYNPRVYDDNNNRPTIRRSCNESEATWSLWLDDNFEYFPGHAQNTPKWKSATFNIIGSINQGSYLWFGGYGHTYYPRFDYGALMYKAYIEYIYEDEEDEEGIEYPDFPYFGYERTYDRKISWYFEYTSQSQNYIRTLTQGVTLTDSRRLSVGYKRKTTQTVQANSTSIRHLTIYKRIHEGLYIFGHNSYLLSKIRKIQEAIHIADTMSLFNNYIRSLFGIAGAGSETKKEVLFFRKLIDLVQANGIVNKLLAILRRLQEVLNLNDNISVFISKIRKIQEAIHIGDTTGQLNDFIRDIFEAVRVGSETIQEHILFRKVYDFVLANSAFEKMLSFIKKLREIVQGSGNNSSSLGMARKIFEGIKTFDTIGGLKNYFRGLLEKVGVGSEIKQGVVFFRKLDDTARAVAVLFRNLFLVVRVITGAFIRNIVLGRFLIAKTELALKSCVCREIILDSRIGNEE